MSQENQPPIPPAEEKEEEYVKIPKKQFEAMQGIIADIGIMSRGIDLLVKAVAPLFPPEEFKNVSKAKAFAVVMKQCWRQKKQIMDRLPKLEGMIAEISPIYPKYLKLNKKNNNDGTEEPA